MENRYGIARASVETAPDFIDLIDTNFNRCGFSYPPDVLRAASVRFFSDPLARSYQPDPAGSPAVRRAVVRYYRGAAGGAGAPAEASRIVPESIIVTASASESYSHIFASQCHRGDHVLLPRPGYPLFEDLADRVGIVVDSYDLDRSERWAPHPRQLATRIGPRTAAIVLISPNNPTGNVVSVPAIREIGELCRQHGLFLVVDEVFSDMLFTAEPLPRPAFLLPDVTVFTINGASKRFASPGLKVSWIVVTGPEPNRADAVDALTIHNDLFLSASSLSQFLTAEMFTAADTFTASMAAEIGRRRAIMLREIDTTGFLSAVPPDGGIHLPVAIDPDVLPSGTDDEDVAVSLLERAHIATHPGYLYGIETPPTLVVSYLSPADRITNGFARLRRYLMSPSN